MVLNEHPFALLFLNILPHSVHILGTIKFSGFGSPAGSQGGDERGNVGQNVEAGSPAKVTYLRWKKIPEEFC